MQQMLHGLSFLYIYVFFYNSAFYEENVYLFLGSYKYIFKKLICSISLRRGESLSLENLKNGNFC